MRILLLIVTVILAGTLVTELFYKKEVHSGVQPTARDILGENSDADIFQYNGLVYINIETIKDIDLEEYQKGLLIGNIIKQSTNIVDFKNGTATKLPKGTQIYQTTGKGLSILMIEKDTGKSVYVALLGEKLSSNY